jgi:hypothetical protein
VIAPAVTLEERERLEPYELGWIDGLWAYAWWKDGRVYVGTTGTTYAKAVDRFLRERGKR